MKALFIGVLIGATQITMAQSKQPANPNVDYDSFETLTTEVSEYREGRLIQIDTFSC